MKKNTPKQGSFRYIVFKDGNTWYAVALEFNIVESGDTHEEAYILLQNAVNGYIESLNKVKGLRDYSPLNQKPADEYEKLWDLLEKKKPIPSPYKVHSFGNTLTTV